MELDVIYNEDCLEGMKRLPDGSVDLVVADAPYNRGKAEWDRIDNYLEWCGNWIKGCERVLKDNGSFYFFHNDMMMIARLILWIEDKTEYVMKQFLVWNKCFDGAHNKGYLDGYISLSHKRNYERMAEYCLFYTFQDETGLKQLYDNRDCFRKIKKYLRTERKKAQLTYPRINEILGTAKGSGLPGHYFSNSQWCLPTAEMYSKLQTTGYFQRSYESLRQEYESLRYTFNNQQNCHSVWNFETACDSIHPAQKPVMLIENIIKHSSNEGDIVLDPFMGSGTTAVACKGLDRHYIGFETEPEYCRIAEQRIAAVDIAKQPDLFSEAAD